MADPKESINIENVVASTGIGQELDLQSVAMDLEGPTTTTPNSSPVSSTAPRIPSPPH